jgi:hypothetical protein
MGVGMLSIFTADPAYITGPNESVRRATWGLGQSALGDVSGWSDFFKSPSVSDTLQKSKTDLEAVFRSSIGTKDDLFALKNRTSQYIANAAPDIRASANAVLSSINGLITNYDAIVSNYQDISKRINQMIVNPLPTTPISVGSVPGSTDMLGVYAQQKYATNSTVILSLGMEATALSARIQNFRKQVQQVQSNTSDLENIAQGKGVAGAIAGLTRGAGAVTSNAVNKVAWIGGIGLAVWLLGPSLLGRGLAAARR